jgi:integrase
VWSPRDARKIYRSFPTESAAKGWRADATSAVRRGGMSAPSPQTVGQAAEAWIAKAEAGEVKKRGGRDYKPAVVRGYRANLRRYVVPAIGGNRLSQLRRRDVQELLVDDLIAAGKSGSKVLNVLNALRAVLRLALRGDELALDPTRGLELPEGAGVRERAASSAEAAELIATLPDDDRALWATACYAGLAAASCAPCAGTTSTSRRT